MFELFFDFLRFQNLHDFSTIGIVKYFISVIFVSPLIGIAFGLGIISLTIAIFIKLQLILIYAVYLHLGTVFALRFCDQRTKSEDTTAQVSLTLSCAYLSFLVSQYLLGNSGIISCCCAGELLCIVLRNKY